MNPADTGRLLLLSVCLRTCCYHVFFFFFFNKQVNPTWSCNLVPNQIFFNPPCCRASVAQPTNNAIVRENFKQRQLPLLKELQTGVYLCSSTRSGSELWSLTLKQTHRVCVWIDNPSPGPAARLASSCKAALCLDMQPANHPVSFSINQPGQSVIHR